MIVEAIGSNDEPSVHQPLVTEQPKKQPTKSKKELLEEIILKHVTENSHIGSGETTTTADRQRILNAKTLRVGVTFSVVGIAIPMENTSLQKTVKLGR